MRKFVVGLILLVATGATLAWLKQYTGNSLMGPGATAGKIFLITNGNLAVTAGAAGITSKELLLESLVTFLNPGDEIKILEQVGERTRVQIIKHNNFFTNVTGWVSTELIAKHAKPKE